MTCMNRIKKRYIEMFRQKSKKNKRNVVKGIQKVHSKCFDRRLKMLNEMFRKKAQ